MPKSFLNNRLELIFNQKFEPLSWDGDWSNLISKKKEAECKDVRQTITFLHASEKILSDLMDSTIKHWEIENINLKNKDYYVLLIKRSPESFVLTMLDNSIGILERKIIKQKLILDDPFHWTKSEFKIDGMSDLNFLSSFVDSLNTPAQEMKQRLSKIITNSTNKDKHDLEILNIQVNQVQSVIDIAKKYLSYKSK